MQLGFVSAIFGELPLEEVLAFAAAEGYDCVEVMCWPAERAGSQVRRRVPHRRRRLHARRRPTTLRALCEKHGVAISALGYYSNPLAADAEEAERAQVHLKKVIDAAPLLGLSIVNSFVGAHTKLPLDENLRAVRRSLARPRALCRGPRRADRHRELPDAVSRTPGRSA